ncbi:unnamed protein product [Nesidiocoris tenuis]|uniref:Uncharacterized protein n=1 Tax=Nesidiocoris tenuis TaxID=355587 RepID=A0A6H5GDB4_9HEMI|nr:unnamed protein product [Nesidiocoris tenuis]
MEGDFAEIFCTLSHNYYERFRPFGHHREVPTDILQSSAAGGLPSCAGMFNSISSDFSTTRIGSNSLLAIAQGARRWKWKKDKDAHRMKWSTSIPGHLMARRMPVGSLRVDFRTSSSIFEIFAGFMVHRQPFRTPLPPPVVNFSIFSKHLFSERLCRTLFFQPAGALRK